MGAEWGLRSPSSFSPPFEKGAFPRLPVSCFSLACFFRKDTCLFMPFLSKYWQWSKHSRESLYFHSFSSSWVPVMLQLEMRPSHREPTFRRWSQYRCLITWETYYWKYSVFESFFSLVSSVLGSSPRDSWGRTSGWIWGQWLWIFWILLGPAVGGTPASQNMKC